MLAFHSSCPPFSARFTFVINNITMNIATLQTDNRLNNTFVHGRSISPSAISTLFAWCTGQQEHRLLWTAIMLTLHGCILTPATVLIVAVTGVNMLLIGISVFAMTFVLISNLAALPTKYTLPIFIGSVLADILIIIAAFSN